VSQNGNTGLLKKLFRLELVYFHASNSPSVLRKFAGKYRNTIFTKYLFAAASFLSAALVNTA